MKNKFNCTNENLPQTFSRSFDCHVFVVLDSFLQIKLSLHSLEILLPRLVNHRQTCLYTSSNTVVTNANKIFGNNSVIDINATTKHRLPTQTKQIFLHGK